MNDCQYTLEELIRELSEARSQNEELQKLVSGLRQENEALSERIENYNLHFSMADDVMYSYNNEFKILAISTNVERVLGYRPDEMIGKSFQSLGVLDPVDMHRAAEDALQVLSGKPVLYSTYQFITKDGVKKYGEVSGVPINKDGRVIGSISVARDITQRVLIEKELRKYRDNLEDLVKKRTEEITEVNKRMNREIEEHRQTEEALQKSEAKYRLLTEHMNDIVGMMDLNLRLIFVSPSIEKIAGFTPEECMQLDPTQMMTPESLARVIEVISEELEREQIEGVDPRRTTKLELEYYHKDGSTMWLETVASFIRDNTGKIVGIHGLSRDINERKRIEEERIKLLAELERSNKDLEQFANIAAHDLQEPLRMVSSFTQLLARRYGDKLDSNARDYIEFAVKGSNRMQKMIQDLLNYSRMVTQRRAPVLADMDSVIEEVMANLQLAISDSGASVTHDALPTVMADYSQLIQVFQNLVGNAIKFRREEPICIHISANQTEDEWIFSVKDNGIGIEPQHFERIFVLFERLHAGEKYQGNGIGLALCKRIIQQLGGRIWVESRSGKGSTFYFTLKRVE